MATDIGSIRVDDFRTLLVVHQTGSLAAAARHLGVSASRMSKIVGRLEQRLGQMLSRRSRGIALTDAARRLVTRGPIAHRQMG